MEFDAHVIVVAFSPTSEPKAYGAPTADSVLRTYLPEIHSSPSPVCSETVVEAATRMNAGKQNLWKVDMKALGADELPVFVGALEVLRTDVQCHLDAMESSRKEKMQP
uniref:MADS-box domain-containing protein n=1 Tax=Setaria italica TaxID=4555 RepID=K3ZMS1_SETIT